MTDSSSSQRPRSSGISILLLAASLVALLGWARFLIAKLHSHDMGVLGLFPSDHPFEDFYVYKWTFFVYHTPLFFQPAPGRSGFAYPPLVALVYRFFYRHHHQITWYFLCTGLVWLVLGAWAIHAFRQVPFSLRRLLTLLLSGALCYPAIFVLERGNLELVVWALVAAGIYGYLTNRTSSAGACFGLAAAMKLYPILLLGLFLQQRGWWRPVLVGLLAAGLSTIVAIAYTGPTFRMAAHGFFEGVTGFQQHYGATIRPAELRFDHSLFSVSKAVAGARGVSPSGSLRWYYLGSALTFTALFFLRIRSLPSQNRVLFFTVGMLLLPPVSYEYTLVHLYIPLCLIVFALVQTGMRLSLAPALTLSLLLILLWPLDLYPRLGILLPGQLQAFLLLITAFLACFRLGPSVTTFSVEQEL